MLQVEHACGVPGHQGREVVRPTNMVGMRSVCCSCTV
jgi:hypothetical protein